MATLTTVQDGPWDDTATWDTGTVPLSADSLVIKHLVQFPYSGKRQVKDITIDGGGIIVADEPIGSTPLGINGLICDYIHYNRKIDDNMPFRLDGLVLEIKYPGISSLKTEDDDFPNTLNLTAGTIIEDSGYFSQSTTLQDIKPEGCGSAHARKIGNAVRFLTFTVRIRQTSLWKIRYLYRMAEGPFQVLATTPSCAIKGYIETVVPDPSSVGKEFVSVKITIAEGPHDGSTA